MHNFSNLHATLSRAESFGETIGVIDGSGVERSVPGVVTRNPIEPASETPGQQRPRFTVRFVSDAVLGVRYEDLDIGTYKLRFPDRIGGTSLIHDIGRLGAQVRGAVILEIFGAGSLR